MSNYNAVINVLGLSALVASQVGTRIYPIQLPTGTVRPAITLQRVSGRRDSVGEGSGGYISTRFQVNIVADTVRTADAIATDIAERLHGWFGYAGPFYIQNISIDNQADVPDIDAGADEQTDFVVRLDITLAMAERPLTQNTTDYQQE